MKLSRLAVVALALTTTLFGACRKKEAAPPEIDQTKTKDFFNKVGPRKQTADFNGASLPKTINFENGVTITFPSGSLKRSGVPVTGKVTVEVYELLTRNNICLMGANTNYTSGATLTTEGIVFVDVKADGISVDQSLSLPINVSIPSSRVGEAFILKGVDQTGNALIEGNDHQMAWAEIPNRNANGSLTSIASNGRFSFPMPTLGWVNCATLYRPAPPTTITVELANNPGSIASFNAYNGETFVYLCARGSNVATQVYAPAGENKVKTADNAVSAGTAFRAIAYCVKEGKYYLGIKDTMTTANQTIQVSMAEVTEEELTQALEELNYY